MFKIFSRKTSSGEIVIEPKIQALVPVPSFEDRVAEATKNLIIQELTIEINKNLAKLLLGEEEYNQTVEAEKYLAVLTLGNPDDEKAESKIRAKYPQAQFYVKYMDGFIFKHRQIFEGYERLAKILAKQTYEEHYGEVK